MNTVTLPAYAKLNLTLDILGKRADGYHELATVMQSVTLHDDVTVTLTECSGIVCRCGTLPGDESNLAVRAAKAFFAGTGIASRRRRVWQAVLPTPPRCCTRCAPCLRPV